MKRAHPITIIVGLIIALLLTGCARHQAPRLGSPEAQMHETMMRAKEEHGPQKLADQRRAVRRLIQAGETHKAHEWLSRFKSSNKRSPKHVMLSAELALAEGHPRKARRMLQAIPWPDELPNPAYRRYQWLRLNIALQKGPIRHALDAGDHLFDMLNQQADQKALRKTLWQLVLMTPNPTLQNLTNAQDPALEGWGRLALLVKRNPSMLEITDSIEQWRQDFPGHPARPLTELTRPTTDHTIHQIAVLLPFHGPLASAGQTIREGILAGYYAFGSPVDETLNIKFYDTSQHPIKTIYHKAIADQADLVIGPLKKNHIKTLVDADALTKPTLALNHLDLAQSFDNLYPIGLDSTNQARQAAYRAHKAGKERAITLAPDNQWGHNLAQTFSQQWQDFEKSIAADVQFDPQSTQSLNSLISRVLGVTASKNRAIQLEQQMNTRLYYQPRRRQDFDAIFLAALPKQAQQIRPLLRFYYASKVPVYAVGAVFKPNRPYRQDSDLNGITFCDIPWVLAPAQALPAPLQRAKRQLQKAQSTSATAHPKLAAAGMDSIYTAINLHQFQRLANMVWPTATGLSQFTGKQIKTSLPCAVIKKGHVHLLRPKLPRHFMEDELNGSQ